MSELFDESFYTKDFDQDMLDYIKFIGCNTEVNWKEEHKVLFYGNTLDVFWTDKVDRLLYKPYTRLTKQQFKDKIGMVDSNTPAESIAEPVAEPDDELEVLLYQDIIDKCKTTNTNLVITGEGVYILDCVNSVEYRAESLDDYEGIINAIELLQRKEVGVD